MTKYLLILGYILLSKNSEQQKIQADGKDGQPGPEDLLRRSIW